MAKKAHKQCKGKTQRGKRCARKALETGFCSQHAPHQPRAHAKPPKPDADLKALASKIKASRTTEEIQDKDSASEMQNLADQQQALVRAIGDKVWNQLNALQRRSVRCLMAERGNVTRACMRAGLNRSFHYVNLEHEAYNTAASLAVEIVHDLNEHDVTTRGTRGIEKIVRHRGLPIPITDPRIPPIIDPETGQPYMVRDPYNHAEKIPFRGYETEIEQSDTIGLHTIRSQRPEKWNPAANINQTVKTQDPNALAAKLAGHVGLVTTDDDLDQSYKLQG